MVVAVARRCWRVQATPVVTIDFDGIAIPRLVRDATAMTMDTSGIVVDVDDTDELFYGALSGC